MSYRGCADFRETPQRGICGTLLLRGWYIGEGGHEGYINEGVYYLCSDCAKNTVIADFRDDSGRAGLKVTSCFQRSEQFLDATTSVPEYLDATITIADRHGFLPEQGRKPTERRRSKYREVAVASRPARRI